MSRMMSGEDADKFVWPRLFAMQDQRNLISYPTGFAKPLRQVSSRRRLSTLALCSLAVNPRSAIAEGSRQLAGTAGNVAREAFTPWLPSKPSAKLAEVVASVLPDRFGSVAVAVVHLLDGTGMALNADDVVPPASLFKLNILAETQRQIERNRVSLAQMITILPEDAAPGGGILQSRIGEDVSVGEALSLMIGISDNTAAFALLRTISSRKLNEFTRSIGMWRTWFYVDERPDETSAGDVVTMLRAIIEGTIASPEGTDHMLELMTQVQPSAWIRLGLPPGTRLAHKSGQLERVRNDAGIVFGPTGPYALSVLTHGLEDPAVGERTITAVTRVVHRFFTGG